MHAFLCVPHTYHYSIFYDLLVKGRCSLLLYRVCFFVYLTYLYAIVYHIGTSSVCFLPIQGTHVQESLSIGWLSRTALVVRRGIFLTFYLLEREHTSLLDLINWFGLGVTQGSIRPLLDSAPYNTICCTICR